MIATTVPVSEDYPEGINYRVQPMDANDTMVLRFDTFPYHPTARRHHDHTAGGVSDDVEFVDLDSPVEAFETAVDAIQRGDEFHG